MIQRYLVEDNYIQDDDGEMVKYEDVKELEDKINRVKRYVEECILLSVTYNNKDVLFAYEDMLKKLTQPQEA